MKICILTTFLPPYGTDADGIYVQSLANSLATDGHEITLVHFGQAYEILMHNTVSGKPELHPAIDVVPVRSSLGLLNLLAIHQSGRPVGINSQLKTAMSHNFDVIHYHNVSLLGGPAIFSSGSAKIKVCSINDHWLICPMHLLWRWTNEVCEKPSCAMCCIHNGRPPQLWRSSRHLDKHAKQIDAFLGPSLFTINKHIEHGLKRPIIHIPSFHAVPEECDPPSPVEQPYFICNGRLEEYKGFQEVIPVFRHFPKFNLLVIGEGSFQEELVEMAEGLPNIRFIDRVSRAQLQHLYAAAIATIVPSLCYQTFCHVTAESFSAGTPVIARRLSAVKEMVETHGGGLLYDETGELESAIETLISADQCRQTLQKEALQAFATEYSKYVYKTRYLAVINELIARKTGGDTDEGPGGEINTIAGQPVFGG